MDNLIEIIERVAGYVPIFSTLTYVICYALGCVCAIRGMTMAARRHENGRQQGSWVAPLSMFTTGAIFVAIPAFLDAMRVSIWNVQNANAAAAANIFSYAPVTASHFPSVEAQTTIVAIVVVIRFVGLIAVARGIHMCNQSGQGGGGPKTFGPGLTFILAGVCAFNFPLFMGTIEELVAGSPTP